MKCCTELDGGVETRIRLQRISASWPFTTSPHINTMIFLYPHFYSQWFAPNYLLGLSLAVEPLGP